MKVPFFLTALLFVLSSAYAQNKTMVDSIMTNGAGGKVVIYQATEITDLMGKINNSNTPSSKGEVKNKKGFRIQVFSSSQQKTAKTEVYNRESKFRNRLPYATYVTYNSPFWKLRVGDFPDQAAALEALNSIKKIFPEYGSELYIVSDNVRIVE